MSEKVVKLVKEKEDKYSEAITEIIKIHQYRDIYRGLIGDLQKSHRDISDKEIKLYIERAIDNLKSIIEIFNEREDSLKKNGRKLENSLYRTSNSPNKLEEI